MVFVRPRLRGGSGQQGGFDPDMKIPTWDGAPNTFARFKEQIDWWLEGENLDFYNTNAVSLAARFVRRQSGPAKTRAMEFKPEQRRGRPAELWTAATIDVAFADEVCDDEDGEVVYPSSMEHYRLLIGTERRPADATCGIRVFLEAYEKSIGREPADKRKELRDEF